MGFLDQLENLKKKAELEKKDGTNKVPKKVEPNNMSYEDHLKKNPNKNIRLYEDRGFDVKNIKVPSAFMPVGEADKATLQYQMKYGVNINDIKKEEMKLKSATIALHQKIKGMKRKSNIKFSNKPKK